MRSAYHLISTARETEAFPSMFMESGPGGTEADTGGQQNKTKKNKKTKPKKQNKHNNTNKNHNKSKTESTKESTKHQKHSQQ